MTRPLLLLPPSKGKAPGGEGPTFASTLSRPHPLQDARREVVARVLAAIPTMDDPAVVRVCGVGRSQVAQARAVMSALDTAPTMPARRRYTGVVHGNAGLAALDPATAAVDVRIVSPLLGLVELDEPVPPYRLELATLPPLGGLASFWRRALADHLRSLATGRLVWDLLPGEHARVWDPAVRADLDVVTLRFRRPDGRAANAARTKVCKGRLAAALLAAPSLGPAALVRTVDPGPGWELTHEDDTVTAVFDG